MELTFTEQIRVIMRRQGVSVAALADRLGTSRQNVNQRLNGGRFTFEDMERYAGALGYRVRVDLVAASDRAEDGQTGGS